MSVQFNPPKGLNQAHLGAFWVTQKSRLPIIRSAQAIASSNELFGDQVQWTPPSMLLALTNEPDCRLQMISADDQWMCQVQRDRLVVNWRKRSEDYPRFSATWNKFDEAWREWRQFLQEMTFSELKPRLWELTYVNRIPRDGLWNSPADWPSVFPGLWGGSFGSIEGVSLRGLQGQWVWESLSPLARLYVEPKPGRTSDNPSQPVLLLSLTARGPILPGDSDSTSDDNAVVQAIKIGMNCGHDLIVNTFDLVASPKAKVVWRRHDDSN